MAPETASAAERAIHTPQILVSTCGKKEVMAYLVMVWIVMAYIVMAYLVMVWIVMAYIVMAYLVVAYLRCAPNSLQRCADPLRKRFF